MVQIGIVEIFLLKDALNMVKRQKVQTMASKMEMVGIETLYRGECAKRTWGTRFCYKPGKSTLWYVWHLL